MDTLASVLQNAAVHGSVAATVRAGGDWGLRMEPSPGAAFHAITSGSTHLYVEGHPAIRLMPGDVVLLPSGLAHDLVSAPGARVQPFDHVAAEAAVEDGGELVVGAAPITTEVVCASYLHDPSARLTPFDVLPDVVHLPALATPPGLRTSLMLIADELRATGPGMRPAIDHVVNVVLIQILRAWSDGGHPLPPSWLRGLGDPVIRLALGELHRDPSFPWTITLLAARAGVSRATLARRFEAEVGAPPGEYLGTWRMELAARQLRTADDTVGTIARRVGYQSEYAFNRAFARRYGTPPGRYRNAHRSSRAVEHESRTPSTRG